MTISFGSDIDSRYVFDASSSVDTYCLEIGGVTNRAHTFLMNGDLAPALGLYQPATFAFGGNDWTIQTAGGTGSTCRFNVWKNKACDEWHASELDYPAGCEPDLVSESLAEGVTDIYTVGGDDTEITCLSAGVHNYVKCQAPTSGDLNDCIDSSFAGDGGGDSLMLYDACLASSSGSSDTTNICDVFTVAQDWELAVFASSTLSDARDVVFLDGIPNASFSLYAYDGCGTALFDRDFVETVYLTQFNSKERVCGGAEYYATGDVTGYYPWFGESGLVNETFVYGTASCAVGELCSAAERQTTDFDPDLDACYREAGSTCYDGRLNQDEVEADYGGVCGLCDENVTKAADTYWLVARETYPSGFFGVSQPFNETVQCQEGEDATNGVVAFVGVILVTLLVVVVVVVLILTVYVTVLTVSTARFYAKLFSRKRKEFKRGGP